MFDVYDIKNKDKIFYKIEKNLKKNLKMKITKANQKLFLTNIDDIIGGIEKSIEKIFKNKKSQHKVFDLRSAKSMSLRKILKLFCFEKKLDYPKNQIFNPNINKILPGWRVKKSNIFK